MLKLSRKQFIAAVLYLSGLIILLSTNPQHLPVVVLLLPLILFFGGLFITAQWAIARLNKMNSGRLSKKRLNILAAMLAGFPFLCILLQSIGQFSIREVFMLIIFFGVLWFYLVRTQATS